VKASRERELEQALGEQVEEQRAAGSIRVGTRLVVRRRDLVACPRLVPRSETFGGRDDACCHPAIQQEDSS